MPQFMYAREYANARNYPYPTVLRWCREGTLPSLPIGNKKYWIDPVEADEVMKELKTSLKYTPKQRQQIERQTQQKYQNNNNTQRSSKRATAMTPELFLKELKKAR